MDHYVIPDIHGRADLLKAALDMIYRNSEFAKITFLGDYIDRGPDSKGVLDILMSGPPKSGGYVWEILRGNHEDMMLQAHKEKTKGVWDWWLNNGGYQTMESFNGPEQYKPPIPDRYLDFVAALPRYTWDDHRIYVHAAVVQAYPLDKQPEAVTQWYRYENGQDKLMFGRYVVHGHTPQKQPFIGKGRCNLDTRAYATNILHVAKFDTDVAGPPIHIYPITVRVK